MRPSPITQAFIQDQDAMPTFEERLTSLEAVVERLERGELSLDESVRLFEEGVHLSNACKQELDKAEGRIQVLVDSPNGSQQLADLDPDDEAFAPNDEDDEDEDEE